MATAATPPLFFLFYPSFFALQPRSHDAMRRRIMAVQGNKRKKTRWRRRRSPRQRVCSPLAEHAAVERARRRCPFPVHAARRGAAATRLKTFPHGDGFTGGHDGGGEMLWPNKKLVADLANSASALTLRGLDVASPEESLPEESVTHSLGTAVVPHNATDSLSSFAPFQVPEACGSYNFCTNSARSRCCVIIRGIAPHNTIRRVNHRQSKNDNT